MHTELSAHLDTCCPADSTSVGSLLNAVHDWAVKKGIALRQEIDTPEKRASVEGVVAYKYDTLVAPRLPQKIQLFVKKGVMASLDAMLLVMAGC